MLIDIYIYINKLMINCIYNYIWQLLSLYLCELCSQQDNDFLVVSVFNNVGNQIVNLIIVLH